MIHIGFKRIGYDSCVYFKEISENRFIYPLLYVDDMLLACQDMKDINKIKELLKAEFEMKELGPAKKVLGFEILRNRDKGILYLSQKGYVEKVLSRYGMSAAKSVITPLAQHFKLSIKDSPGTDQEKAYVERVPYSSVVGSLMYSMVCTRPDLAHVSLVSRYLSNPGKAHWEATKWIL